MPTKPSPIGDDSNVPSVNSDFYPQALEINADLWDKYIPYQLVLIEALPNGKYVSTGEKFTLPMPPQELNLDIPFATQINANLTGVTIQHGGAPFRNIALQGTTGIVLQKNRGKPFEQRLEAESIFAGTISAAGTVNTAVQKADNNTGQPLNINIGASPGFQDDNHIDSTTTGYYQMRLMERFIESYVSLKTNSTSRNDTAGSLGLGIDTRDPKTLRMGFCIWKDEAVYLVEPMQLTKRRTAANPMEYMYTLVLRGWRRIELEGASDQAVIDSPSIARNPNALVDAFNKFREITAIVEGSNNVLRAVINDPVNLLSETLRETTLFLSAFSGLKTSLTHLPDTITNDCLPIIQRDWMALRSQFHSFISMEADTALRSPLPLNENIKNEIRINLFPNLSPELLRLPQTVRNKIDLEKERIQKFNRKDFEEKRDFVQATAADFADRVGAGNVVFSETYNRALPTVSRSPTSEEFDILYALNEATLILDQLAATSDINPTFLTSMEYVAGLAEKSGIAFKIPQSKFAVPFPYGASLEQIALQYLKDANRWHEIATLNGLREPYVDEEGFTLQLITNGHEDTVMVSDISNLFVGQTVWILSNTVKKEKRHITKLETLEAGQNIITLDGDPDLQKFLVSNSARLEAFLPGTVNSQKIIYIPSTVISPESSETKAVPGVDEFDPLLSVSGVDLLLTPSGDLAITPDGDVRLAYGLANIVQTVKLALSTPRGSLIQHPEYGLSIKVGMSTADLDTNELLKNVKSMFSKDRMFSGIRAASIVQSGPVLKLVLDIGIAGTSQFVPVSIVIN